MNRSKLFLAAVLAAVLLFAPGCGQEPEDGPAQATAAPEHPPNLLLLVVDTLRRDRLGAYGHSRETSPTIDRELADRGVTFDSAYAPAPWTLPSMIGLVTGQHPWRLLGDDPRAFATPDELPVLAERLQAHGYRTAGFAANALLHPRNGFGRGFDTYYHVPVQRDPRRHAEHITDRALDWLAETATDERPFFLYLHFMDPHDPYGNADTPGGETPFLPEYDGSYLGQDISDLVKQQLARDDPTTGVDPRDAEYFAALYDSEIRYLDRHIHQLLEAIPPEVLAETLVVFTADHGEELGDHGYWLHAHTVYDELVRIPLILRWDGVLPTGQRVEAPADLLDLAPTLLAAAGASPLPSAAGIDLLAPLEGATPWPRRPAFAATALHNRPLRATLVAGDYKLHFFDRRGPLWDPRSEEETDHHIARQQLPRRALYHLGRDPGEQHNLLAQGDFDPRHLHRLEETLHRHLEQEIRGLRLVARALPEGHRLVGRLKLDPAPERWISYLLAEDDKVTLDGDELHFELKGEGFAKGIALPGQARAITLLEVQVDGDPIPLRVAGEPFSGQFISSEALATRGWPQPPRRPTLDLWHRAPHTAPPVDEEREEENRRVLEALGYL